MRRAKCIISRRRNERITIVAIPAACQSTFDTQNVGSPIWQAIDEVIHVSSKNSIVSDDGLDWLDVLAVRCKEWIVKVLCSFLKSMKKVLLLFFENKKFKILHLCPNNASLLRVRGSNSPDLPR